LELVLGRIEIVIADPKSGKSYQKELKDPDSKSLIGHKIGDNVKGEIFGMHGYELEITGGSDYCGFPMRRDVMGVARKKILSTKGIGIQDIDTGDRKRKTVAGNTVFDKTSQVNLKVVKHGKSPLEPPAVAEGEKKEGEQAAK